MSIEELAEVQQKLDEHLTKGWIKLSVLPYKEPIFFVNKKEGIL